MSARGTGGLPRIRRRVCAYEAAVGLMFLACAATAQNTLSVGPAGVAANDTVVVPIVVDTATKLTGLVADLEFDAALCAHIGDQRLELGERVALGRERVVLDAEETFGCPQAGRVSLVLIDLVPRAESGEAVVPAGGGEIARWSFVVNAAAPAPSYPVTVRVKAARNGPDTVALQTAGGFVTCAGNCNGDGEVAVNELITGVNIAGGDRPAGVCAPMDTNRDDTVVINELVAAVNSLLDGCKVGR